MDAVFAIGISKGGLVTDEYDPPGLGDSRHGNQSIAPGGHYGKRGGPPSTIFYETPQQFQSQSFSGGSGQVLSGGPKSYNFEIEPGHLDFLACSSVSYSKPFSGDSSGSSTGHSTPSSDIAGNPRSGSNARKPSLSRAGAQRPSRCESTGNRMILQTSLLTNYSWDEVEEMIQRASGDGDRDRRGPPGILLGRGGFGNVFKGMLAKSPEKPPKLVAVKILGVGTDQGDQEFLNEVNLLSRVNHRNLVKLLGYCQEGHHRVLVYEYADQGSIGDHIHGTGTFLDWRTRLKICLDSAYGLEYLHTGCSPRIIHRDIKSSNILLTQDFSQDWVAKVADFGLSKIGMEDDLGGHAQVSTRVKGTPGYLDPAYTNSGKLDEKIDIYSFGMLLWEMISGRKPNDPSATQPLVVWVKQQSSGSWRALVDPMLGREGRDYNPRSMKEVQALALACIDEIPSNRPDIRKVVLVLRIAKETENNAAPASRWNLRRMLGPT